MISKKIIIQKKDVEKMEAWEKIFFMLLDTKKAYPTMGAIGVAAQQFYKLEKKLSQGTVSKHFDVLSGLIEYDKKTYTLRKLPKKDENGIDTDEKEYRLITTDESDVLWQMGKDKLSEKKCLVSGAVCVVSKHMFIFKIKTSTRTGSTTTTGELKKGELDKIEFIKKTFSEMILPDCLFSVSYFDGNIAVILNSQNRKSKEKYSSRLENFFELGS